MGTKGLWVGKFETGYKWANTTDAARFNPNMAYMTDEQIQAISSRVQIKPNVYSWRSIQVANAHLVSYNYHRELDSHMMKNTEWGAIAYLQHSKYGSANSVRINNNSAYITGYSAKNEPTCGYTGDNRDCNKYESTARSVDGTNTYNYKNPSSQVASTTGNYTGIYDMSGGAHEYVMGVMLDPTNKPLSGWGLTINSDFNGPLIEGGSYTDGIHFPNEKYFDKYNYSTSEVAYQRRILGDGTAEFGPFAIATNGDISRSITSWYSGITHFVNSDYMWFLRGNIFSYGIGANIFGAYHEDGQASVFSSFRIVLAI